MNAELNQISEAVIGCAFRASKALGSGFLESVYENAMALELRSAGMESTSQKRFTVKYRGQIVGDYIADLLVEESLIVEIKAVRTLTPEHQAQLLNYLNASGLCLGLLLNFGALKVQIKRVVHSFQD